MYLMVPEQLEYRKGLIDLIDAGSRLRLRPHQTSLWRSHNVILRHRLNCDSFNV